MRKFLSVAVTAMYLFLSSCDKLIQFNMPYQTSFQIPASPIGLLGNIATPPITTNTASIYSNNNTEAQKVTSVLLKSMKLTITNPSGETFAFMQACDVYVGAPNMVDVKVATISGINDNAGNSINMTPVSGVELKQYLEQDNIIIKTAVTTDQIVTQTTDVQIDAVFHVSANPLKLLK